MKTSDFFKLDLQDLIKGILLAFITVFVTTIGVSINQLEFPTVATLMLGVKLGGVASISYLIKNLLTNSNGDFLKLENK